LGAVAGVACVLVGVWMLVPAFANTPGWPARAVRGSAIARGVDRFAPHPPGSLAVLGLLVGDAPFPQVFERLTSADAGTPPGTGLRPEVLARVEPSVVRIDGRACDQLQQGSGVVVAEDLVLTNAHVVAGNRATSVMTHDGREITAAVVGFDPRRDLALVRTLGLGLPAPERRSSDVDTSGSVIGYPQGGPQRESPARIAEEITATGTDIYRSAETERSVFVLGAVLRPGDSGGPLFDREGRVVGIAFAVDPGEASTAYALTDVEIRAGLREFFSRGTTEPVHTGACLVG
jgi:S1-C subfamily serine protease